MSNKAFTKIKDLANEAKALDIMKNSEPTKEFSLMEKRIQSKINMLEI